MTGAGRRFFVVTPVLNGAKYLPAALASIEAQGFTDWTHYVVDGGSSDGTVEITQKSMETEPRRRLICGTDRGLYDALFKGFAAIEAEGLADDDICLWLNADDYLAPWAFATMRQAFDMFNADWVTGQPGRWDAQGRLVLVEPKGWYPRWCIAHGWFNSHCLGSIQQESTFFTARLLRQLPPDIIESIRSTRMAGDFLLWRALARLRSLRAAPTLIGGFRSHSTNLSIEGVEHYSQELRAHGAFLPPASVGRVFRLVYRILAAIIAAMNASHPLIDRTEVKG
jgi:glycosyltransferase involved in cell wall biosynthesis